VSHKRGVAICHYNRLNRLPKVLEKTLASIPSNTKVVVCDDGSDLNPNYIQDDDSAKSFSHVEEICKDYGVILVKGPNLGVGANKNRALWALQDCQYICILEDDLAPDSKGWFEAYEKAAQLSGINHFCRVQDKEISGKVSTFDSYMAENGLHPIYATSPRGDFTFITRTVLKEVGGFNSKFRGAGYAHGEWSERVWRAGLINHPQKWIDIREGRDKLIQLGDTEGGRWDEDSDIIKKQLHRNKKVLKELQRNDYQFHPLVLE